MLCLSILVGYYMSPLTQRYRVVDFNGVVLIIDDHECKIIWIKDQVLDRIEHKLAAPMKELYYNYHAYDIHKPYMISRSLTPVNDIYPFVIPANYEINSHISESRDIISITFYNPKNNKALGIEIYPNKKKCSFIDIIGDDNWKRICYKNAPGINNNK